MAERTGTISGPGPLGPPLPRERRITASHAGAAVYPSPLPRNLDERLSLVRAPDSPEAAAFRILAHKLAAENAPRVLLFTSPAIEDGKTTCILNVAAALGERGGRRPVILELAVRRPSLARILGFQPPLCVTEQIARCAAGELDNWLLVEPAIAHDTPSSPRFHVAAASPKPVALAMDPISVSESAQSLLRAGYGQVLIDCASLAEGADAVVLQRAVQGVVLVARAGRTTARSLRAARESLDDDRFSGVVLVDG